MKPFNKSNKFGKGDGGRGKRKDFKKSNFEFGGGGRDRHSDRGGFDKPRRRGPESGLYEAICAQCGRQCEVPFRPTGSKPVLCRDCFRQNESLNSGDSYGNSGGGRKPRRRPESSHYGDAGRGAGDAGFAAELDNINRKLDKIMEALDLEE